ncbi:hypothetical protein IC620_09010 [Hazenella sp. IB182357]|uniref:Phage tail tape measure protein n=1 Tax=Polycladospora coralii TaxID=2771432 RepID=A0A926RXG5_9BACL|nr:hypothetical protein [Polycladospora coralii]MBD1372496.1 hypothetical protein [Polycladospora coralii]
MSNNIGANFISIEKKMEEISYKLENISKLEFEKKKARKEKDSESAEKSIGKMASVGYGALTLSLISLAADNSEVKTAIDELKTAFDGLGSTLSTIFVPVVNMITDVVNAFNGLPESVKIVLLIGLMLAGAFIGLIQLFALFSSVMTTISGAALTLAGALSPMILVFAGMVFAIAALVAGLLYAYTHFEWFKNLMTTIWNEILAFMQPIITQIVDFFLAKWQQLSTWWMQIWPQLQMALMNVWNAIWVFLQPIVNAIVILFEFAWNLIKDTAMFVWNQIKSIIDLALLIIMGIIESFAYLFTGEWEKLGQSVWKIVLALCDYVQKTFANAWNLVLNIVSNVLTSLRKLIKNQFNRILDIASSILGEDLVANAREMGNNFINMLVDGIKDGIAYLTNILKSVSSTISDYLGFSSPTKKGPGSRSHKWAPNFMDMFTAGIYAGLPGIKQVANQSATQLAVMNGGHKNVVVSPTSQGFGSGANTINISELVVREEADIERIAQKLHKMQMGTERAGGAISYGY